jgi:RNA-directed DNA polymerase
MKNSRSALLTISEPKFLRAAWKEISKKNRRSKGVDNVTIEAFKKSLDDNLNGLSKSLREGVFKFEKLRAHAIKRAGKKPRPIQIATVKDRVVMKAISRFLAPTFQAYDLECSYAFIKGRGVSRAVEQVKQLIADGNKFYFEADIINFFGSVEREQLWKMFSKKIRQKSLLPLVQDCFNLELENLQSYETEFQNLFFGVDSGIPQGGMLSPMLANFYLHYFDRRMLERGFHLIRYADDFVVMCSSREQARSAYEFSRELLKTLHLSIHPLDVPGSKSKIGFYPKDGLTFLGIRFEGAAIFPAQQAVMRFKTKVVDVLKPNTGDSLFKTLQKLTNLINGWGQSYKMMRVAKTYQDLDEFIKSSVEKYLSVSGIRLVGKNKRKQLKILGIPSLTSMVVHLEKSSN